MWVLGKSGSLRVRYGGAGGGGGEGVSRRLKVPFSSDIYMRVLLCLGGTFGRIAPFGSGVYSYL